MSLLKQFFTVESGIFVRNVFVTWRHKRDKTMTTPNEVLEFWLDEIGPKGWYSGGEDLDAQIVEKFETLWGNAVSGGMGHWLTYPNGALAYLILTDQFPRNMFRNMAKAFATDEKAREVAACALRHGDDIYFYQRPYHRSFIYVVFYA